MCKIAFLIRLLLILVLFLNGIKGISQNSIITIPPPNDFRFEDLWNLTITKDLSSQYTTHGITLRIFDAKKGMLVEAKSNTFEIAGSSYTVNNSSMSQLLPFEYTYNSSDIIREIIQRGGLFPAGEYTFHYQLFGFSAGTQTKLDEYTFDHIVIMPTFLQLVSVFDKDTLLEDNPTFMWIPSSAKQTLGNYEQEKEFGLTYTISIAEVLTNQTPYMAITSNPKFLFVEGLENTLITYPFSARKFEPCKTYAWQVKALVNGQVVTTSEIWTFSTPCERELIISTTPVLVKQSMDLATCDVINNTVNFAYYEEYDVEEHAQLNVKIYNSKGKLIADEKQLNLAVKKGYNTYTLNTCPKGVNILNGENYTLIITNSKKEKWYLRIVNNQKTNTCY